MASLIECGTVLESRQQRGELLIVRFDFQAVSQAGAYWAVRRLREPLDRVLQCVRTYEGDTAGWNLYLLDEWGIDELGLAALAGGGKDYEMLSENLGADRRGALQIMGRHWFAAYAAAAAPRGWAEFECYPPGRA